MIHYRQHVGVSCMTELVEIFGNIFVLSDYQGHFTFIMEQFAVTSNNVSDGGFVR